MPDQLISPSSLSPAERLWVWRRDLGLTQAAAALRLGIGLSRYSRAELGLSWPDQATGQSHPSQAIRLGLPTPIETGRPVTITPKLALPLARRRSGKTLRQIAKGVGVSHMTLLKWERRENPRLMDWWMRQGFQFTFD